MYFLSNWNLQQGQGIDNFLGLGKVIVVIEPFFKLDNQEMFQDFTPTNLAPKYVFLNELFKHTWNTTQQL